MVIMALYVQVPFDGNSNGHWITLIAGRLKIKLSPNEECMEKFKCKTAEITLNPGETGRYRNLDVFKIKNKDIVF